MNGKKWMTAVLAAALALTMAACAVPAEAQTFENTVLNVYNWGEYIDKSVLTSFEKEYGVKVNYSLFSSNEEMYVKLQSGAAYDVIIPSAATI